MDVYKLYKMFKIVYGILTALAVIAILGLFIENGPTFIPNFNDILSFLGIVCFIGMGIAFLQTVLFFIFALRKIEGNFYEYKRTLYGLFHILLFVSLVLLGLLIKETKNSFY